MDRDPYLYFDPDFQHIQQCAGQEAIEAPLSVLQKEMERVFGRCLPDSKCSRFHRYGCRISEESRIMKPVMAEAAGVGYLAGSETVGISNVAEKIHPRIINPAIQKPNFLGKRIFEILISSLEKY